MSLKDLISTLIEAVFGSKKAFISNQAMPNEQSNVITHSFSSPTSFVAPSDGYVCLVAEDSSNTWYRVSLIENAIRYLFNSNAGAYFGSGWFAVRKGATIGVSVNVDVSASIKFISTIGGGINRLCALAQAWVRGGVLWLTSLIHSGLGAKACSRLERNGPYSKQRLQRSISTKQFKSDRTTSAISLRRLTVMYLLARLASKISVYEYLSHLTPTVQELCYRGLRGFVQVCLLGFLFRLKKVVLSLCSINRIRTSISDLFLRQEGITSLNATEVCHA